MAQFDYLWEGGPEFAQSKHFRFGTDAVLLGNYINLTGAKKAIDLGCASGVIALLMLSRSRTVHVTGLEINADAADLAAENMAHNNLSERSSILQGDIRKVRETLPAGSFDVVVSNAREVFGLTARNRINKGFPGHTPLFLCPETRAVRHRMAA